MKQQQKTGPKQSPDGLRSSRQSESDSARPGVSPVPKNGLRVTTFRSPVAGPPTLMVVENDGRHVKEEQSLVGNIEAGFDKKHVLELYGVDLRYAIHNPETGRWERCLFSYPLADMLEMLTIEGEFPFAFEAIPSQAEVDWADLKTRGKAERPMLPLNGYLTPATPESLSAVVDDDRMRVRRGQPKADADGDAEASRHTPNAK